MVIFARLSALDDQARIANLRAFLRQSASRLIIDAARYRQLLEVDPAIDVDAIASAEPNPSERLEIERRCDRPLAALAELPAKRRHAFLLHRFEGHCYGEIARMLGVSVRTVETHVRLAMAHCRMRIEILPRRWTELPSGATFCRIGRGHFAT